MKPLLYLCFLLLVFQQFSFGKESRKSVHLSKHSIAWHGNFKNAGAYFYCNKNIQELYNRLYDLNKTLSISLKIVILPIDIERNYRKGIKYLQTPVVNEKLASMATGKPLLVINMQKWAGKQIVSAYNYFYSTFFGLLNKFRIMLANDFIEFAYLIRHINETLNISVSGNS